MEIKRFLGFTDSIKEPQKTRVENVLCNCYSYNGKVYNAVTFLCVKLLEGCYSQKEENYQYHKRNGELSKPRTLYKYVSPDGETYFELNKTQYDFVCHLIKNKMDTEESMVSFDKADVARVEALKQTEDKEKLRQEAEEQKRAEEIEEVKKFISEQSQHITQDEKEIVDNVFLSVYGNRTQGDYSLVALIHNFDNPYCKDIVISRLHNDNKASIKIFECMTGLKLPRSYKERAAYLNKITKADFKGMAGYNPRKKRKCMADI